MRYMLDTNICIYVIKSKPEKVFKNLQTIHPEDVYIIGHLCRIGAWCRKECML